ncbi:DgyrCDS14408 [Dimorphilus gyrociliatus]|uniref:DgyrCDS14408 n=1 Tax=Dimorphilus gyrociliatus TaxID=2664684 RepID=A0A7I8WDV9_9ANNE|nr:DgyrCDS14408 [Dimorphilus gyrociliatus]
MSHCSFAVEFNGVCICGRCSPDSLGKHYLKHPVTVGCMEITDIPDCNEYTLKLAEGEYISVCKECSNGKIVSKDGQSCLSCGQCDNGIHKLNSEGDICECTCLNKDVLNPNSNGCLDCSLAQIPECKTFEFFDGGCLCVECLPPYERTSYIQCINCQNEITCTGGTAVLNSGNECECTCSNNTLLNSNSNGCVICSLDQIPNCKIFKLVNDVCTCSECLANYQPQGKTQCIINTNGGGEAIANCKEYNSPTGSTTASECIECNSGWALEPASPSSASKCHQCQTGCKSCTLDVTSSPSTVNKCTECSSRYALNNAGTCIQCPYNCGECRVDPENQNNAICLSLGCSSGALKDSDFSCDSCSIANCEICVQQIIGIFKCLKCNRGYYKDNSGNCLACVANCPVCLNDQYCISDGCKECFIRHRTEGTCLPCPGDGVARYSYQTPSSNVLIPQICKIGYRINKSTNPGFCERCDPNCKKCSVNGIAKCDDQQCNSGYFYDPIE